MMTLKIDSLTAISTLTTHLRANGPVTRNSLESYALEQIVGCDDEKTARAVVKEFIRVGRMQGWVENYDGMSNVYEYRTHAPRCTCNSCIAKLTF